MYYGGRYFVYMQQQVGGFKMVRSSLYINSHVFFCAVLLYSFPVFITAKYKVRHLTFFLLVIISWMVTLSSYLIWQIISFILPPNEYGSVYAWITLGSRPAIDLQMPILTKKSSFQMKLILILAPRTHTLKSRRIQNESLFGADFSPEA